MRVALLSCFPYFCAVVVLTGLWLGPGFACAGKPDSSELRRRLTVSGEGVVTVKPDTASIAVGVVTESTTAGEALSANTQKMGQVMVGFRGLGIAQKDLRTSAFSVSPIYARPDRLSDGNRSDRRIVGYRVSNKVTAIIRDLDKVGSVLDQVVTLGANSVDALSFFIEETAGELDRARALAVADAQRKASVLARAAGVQLGEILTINEVSGYRPKTLMPFASVAKMAADVPVASGTQEIRATVSLVIALE